MKSIDLAPLRPPEVQRNTFLVTAGEYPAPVKLRPGDTGELRIDPPQVAAARPLYLDHFGAKVRHHGGRRRPRDIGSTIDNPDSGEQTTVIHFSDTSTGMNSSNGESLFCPDCNEKQLDQIVSSTIEGIIALIGNTAGSKKRKIIRSAQYRDRIQR